MSDLKKAQQLRARKEMVRQKQQDAIEKRDIARNAIRSKNIARRKKAAEKVGKTFSYKDTVTPSVEVGPINYGSPMKKSSCIKMYDSKGKPAGLMAEGSMAYMESALQHSGKSKMHAGGKEMPDDGHLHYEKVEGQKARKKVESPGVSETNKLSDTSGGVGQMSPYKFTGMSGGSAMHKENPKESEKPATMDPGQSFHYAGGDKTIRKSFDEAYAKAKKGGYDTFRFGHSGVEDPKTGKFKFKTQVYTTK